MYKIKYLDGSEQEFETLEGANLQGANLREANLLGADLWGANLIGANLEGADLADADLKGANLREANLADADLKGADLTNTNVQSFCFGKHFGFAHFGEQYETGSLIKIGCISDSLEDWLLRYEERGVEEGYTPKEIKLYGDYLKLLKENNHIK